MKALYAAATAVICTVITPSYSQALRIPGSPNIVNTVGTRIAVTDIEINYSAPGVKGREGKIYGTDVVPYGYTVLGFGSNVASPWRAGADEATTISFSTDVMVNGKFLPAGTYAFFIAVQPDVSTLIFNRNTAAWGSYFYRKDLDVLQVPTTVQKDLPVMQERLQYSFVNHTDSSVDVHLRWEKWNFPMHITIDRKQTVLEDIRRQMSGAIGFDPASLEAAAAWCDANNINYDEALNWINSATNANLGGRNHFSAYQTKASLLEKTGKAGEAKQIMAIAAEQASAIELHQYGRQLMAQNKMDEAQSIFEKNYAKNKGAWPTAVGMMRIHAARADYKKALPYAKEALAQAPDDVNKKFLEGAVKNLEAGKPIG